MTPTTTTPTTTTPSETNPPVVTISGITSGGTYSGTITIGVSITDESSLGNAIINIKGGSVDNSEILTLTLSDTKWISYYTLDTTTIPNGTYTISIEVYDILSNMATVSFTISIDNAITSQDPSTSLTADDITPGFEVFSVLIGMISLAVGLTLKNRKK